ncbi:MAG: tetratricopeptide repeat protein [Pseudomonadales bacterium]|nr:tetratricopeptide repeat protein [Pseudomonadales bacterium]
MTSHSSVLLLLLIMVETTLAADTVLGPSSAYLCFDESRWGKSIRGIGDCDKAIADNELLSKRDLAATYSNRGIIYSANGIYDLAIRDHSRAIEIRPLLGQAIVNRGNVYFRMGEYEEAVANYDQALQISGSANATTYLNRGLALLEMKSFEQAKASFEQARALNPSSRQIVELPEGVEAP